MRITNSMITSNFMSNYNNDLSKLTTLQQELSTGKSFSQPSDNPLKAVRSLQFYSDLSENAMYTQNANDAVSWMSTTNSAATQVVNSLTQVQTLVTQAATSGNASSDNQDIAKQITQIVSQLVDYGNTQLGDRYVFAGQNDRTQPFSLNSSTGVVTYQGDTGVISMQVSPGQPDPTRDKINLNGSELFGAIGGSGSSAPGVAGQPQIFTDLQTIVKDIQGGDVSTISNDLGMLQTDIDGVTNAQATIAARQSTYTAIQTNLTGQSVTIKTNISDNEGVDVAQTSIDFQNATNVYNSALSVGAQILPMSLVDYLK